jgi:probable phosphoglycerate mutase
VDETTFLLIRHAESTWNAAGRWQGQGDPPLSARGRGQADTLAAALADERIDALVTSDLRRAAETAAALGRRLGLTPVADPRLRERDVGAWTGLTEAEVRARDPEVLARFRAHDSDARPGGGEGDADLARRARTALASIAASREGERIAIVTHLGVVRSLLGEIELPNTGFRVLRACELVPTLQRHRGGP